MVYTFNPSNGEAEVGRSHIMLEVEKFSMLGSGAMAKYVFHRVASNLELRLAKCTTQARGIVQWYSTCLACRRLWVQYLALPLRWDRDWERENTAQKEDTATNQGSPKSNALTNCKSFFEHLLNSRPQYSPIKHRSDRVHLLCKEPGGVIPKLFQSPDPQILIFPNTRASSGLSGTPCPYLTPEHPGLATVHQ